MKQRIYALTTSQGTAMAETALCNRHYTVSHSAEAFTAAGRDLGSHAFVDCTGNDQLACRVCGATSEDFEDCDDDELALIAWGSDAG